MKLVTDAFDALASDNSASMHLPLIRPLSVYVSDSIGSVTSSLKGIEGLRFASSPAEYVDLIVTDKEADLKSSCKTVFTNGFVPEGLRGLIEVENKPSVLVDWSNYDPLLQYAQLSELIVNSAPRIKGEAGDVEKRGFETVAFGKNGPLIVKKNWAGNISYHTLFDIEKSTLPYRVAFPVIMMNLVNLARSQAGISDSNGISTGILPELDLQANSPCEILLG